MRFVSHVLAIEEYKFSAQCSVHIRLPTSRCFKNKSFEKIWD